MAFGGEGLNLEAKVKPTELKNGRVHIDARIIANGEQRARKDPEGYGKTWLSTIRRAAEQKGLTFVDPCDKSEMIAAAAANGGKCNTISIGSDASAPPVPPFTKNFAICTAVTNDMMGDRKKAKADPDGVVGNSPLKILVNEGIDSFWAQVLYSNCYPRANLPGACLKTEVPRLKDVMFALGHEVPKFANLVDGEDYIECLRLINANKREQGADVPKDPFNVVEGVLYREGHQFQLKGLVNKPELNGRRVRVAKCVEWHENAAAHPGRVQVVLEEGGAIIFAKPANLAKVEKAQAAAASSAPSQMEPVVKSLDQARRQQQELEEFAKANGLSPPTSVCIPLGGGLATGIEPA
jgi:hypothetical protein